MWYLLEFFRHVCHVWCRCICCLGFESMICLFCFNSRFVFVAFFWTRSFRILTAPTLCWSLSIRVWLLMCMGVFYTLWRFSSKLKCMAESRNECLLWYAKIFMWDLDEMTHCVTSIYPSSPAYQWSGRGGSSPDLPLPSHFIQLFRGDLEAFPGQLRDIVPSACPRYPEGLLPVAHALTREASGGILTRCLNHLIWLLLGAAALLWTPPGWHCVNWWF